MDSPATPVGLSPPLLSLVLRNESCYTKGKEGLLRQRLGFAVDRVHGSGSRERTAEIDLIQTDGRDRSVHDRLTGDGDDDVSDEVTSGGGSAALRHKRRAPRRRSRRGELTDDQNVGGRPTDGGGVEEKAAEKIGSTAATVLRRSSATAKRWTGTAATWRSRRWPSRVTTTTIATAAHGWTNGGDGGAKAQRLGRYTRRRAKAKEAAGRGELGGPFKGASERRRRPTATGGEKERSDWREKSQSESNSNPPVSKEN
uniref:Retrotransposon protein, putative, Ty3-gypsy subclass n=2 Tax=Oryza sativa subsp. japonica TaxID=39947 RepID=Q7G592_ORYSJ|nr:Unknown protein [Oryza sativa Japonica Group]AAP52179.1 retrotransposon protein, putative, Ty3-gypsy subclass [Oryza sativa Japonica Group]